MFAYSQRKNHFKLSITNYQNFKVEKEIVSKNTNGVSIYYGHDILTKYKSRFYPVGGIAILNAEIAGTTTYPCIIVGGEYEFNGNKKRIAAKSNSLKTETSFTFQVGVHTLIDFEQSYFVSVFAGITLGQSLFKKSSK